MTTPSIWGRVRDRNRTKRGSGFGEKSIVSADEGTSFKRGLISVNGKKNLKLHQDTLLRGGGFRASSRRGTPGKGVKGKNKVCNLLQDPGLDLEKEPS